MHACRSTLEDPTYEGTHCFEGPCSPAGLTMPVYEYSSGSGSGNCSVTGGYVYRGTRIPPLAGLYVYGDYCSGRVWTLGLNGAASPTNTQVGTVASNTLVSFGRGPDGELYVVKGNGEVLRIDPNPVVGSEEQAGAAGLTLALAGPNPARGETTLRFASAAGGASRLALLDVLGREVAVLFAGTLAPGEARTATVAAGGLAPGLYVARLGTPEGARSVRLVIAR